MQNKEVTVNKSKFHCENMQTKNHILPLINKCNQPVNHNVRENRKNTHFLIPKPNRKNQ